MFDHGISVKAMLKPVLFALAAGLLMTGCARREFETAAYAPPAVTLTVADRDHVDDADHQAQKFCRKYDKRAERELVTTKGDSVTLTYECR